VTDLESTTPEKSGLKMYLDHGSLKGEIYRAGFQDGTTDREFLDQISYLQEMNTAERIVPVLVQYIRKEGMVPGDQLPPEKKLGSIIGIGHRALREALIILRSIGLVIAKPGKGWYVGKFDPVKNLRFIAPVLKEFCESDWKEIMYSRLANEPMIAHLAAKSISPEGLEKLDQALEGMDRACQENQSRTYRHYDRLFHQIISEECGNGILAMQSSMMAGLFYSMTWWAPERNMAYSVEEHKVIYEAIQAGNAEAAEKAMAQHLRGGIEWFDRHGVVEMPLGQDS
jgi:GntR family transcriptional regulator, transcriptional repressor for pyruvate dehydrogenase complex